MYFIHLYAKLTTRLVDSVDVEITVVREHRKHLALVLVVPGEEELVRAQDRREDLDGGYNSGWLMVIHTDGCLRMR